MKKYNIFDTFDFIIKHLVYDYGEKTWGEMTFEHQMSAISQFTSDYIEANNKIHLIREKCQKK